MDTVVTELDGASLIVVVAAVIGLLLLASLVLWIVRSRQRKPAPTPQFDLTIDVGGLSPEGPPNEGPVLEFFGRPVRLVALVLAPAGRYTQLPPEPQLFRVLDDVTPGLSSIVSSHRPLFRPWPSQLSTQGFIHAFFAHVHLPGGRGKGTPWCSAAGRFDAGDQQFLAGILCAAEKPNSLGQVPITNVGQWLEVVRVKT